MIDIVVTCSLFFHNMSSRSLTTAAKPSYFLFYICWLSFVLCYFCCSSYALTHSKPTANSQPCCSACGRSCSTSRASPARTGTTGRLLLVGTGAPGKGRRMGDGQDRQGTGDSWSSRMENTRPATAPCLQLLRMLFQPLPGLCSCWYSCAPPCFWRKSLYQEKERSN